MPQSLTQLAPREKRRLKSLCENSVLLHVAPAFQAGTEGRGDTKNARLKGGRYKTVPILSSHTDSSAPTQRLGNKWALAPEASGPKSLTHIRLLSDLKLGPATIHPKIMLWSR